MKANNLIQGKSYTFAICIVRLYQHLSAKEKEFVLSKQLLRSGTSIGANVEEALGGQSRADFLSKISIAYKEARESKYWIRILTDTDYLTADESGRLLKDIDELCRILSKIITTTKESS